MTGTPGIASADSLWCTARAPWLFRDSQKFDLSGQLASYDFDDQTQKSALDGSKVFKGQVETKWTSFWPVKGYVSTARFASCPLLTPSFSNFHINCLFATIWIYRLLNRLYVCPCIPVKAMYSSQRVEYTYIYIYYTYI